MNRGRLWAMVKSRKGEVLRAWRDRYTGRGVQMCPHCCMGRIDVSLRARCVCGSVVVRVKRVDI